MAGEPRTELRPGHRSRLVLLLDDDAEPHDPARECHIRYVVEGAGYRSGLNGGKEALSRFG